MTVIFSNFGDVDTQVLENLWSGLDANVVALTKDSTITESELDEIIEKEKDTLLICGHGFPSGCLDPRLDIFSILTTASISKLKYTISSRNIDKIKAKNVIGIWCYASEFARTNNLHGFYPSMFISSTNEALLNGICNVSQDEITKSEVKFCNIINQLLKDKTPLESWKNVLSNEMDETNDVEVFNYSNTVYRP